MTIFNPEIWLESSIRVLKEYAESVFNSTFEVVMEFPGPLLDARKLPMDKTVVHFEIDDTVSMPVGIGMLSFNDNYDAVNHTVNPQYAAVHTLNFDVGVWSSDASGGTTSRLRARQYLQNAFGFPQGIVGLRDFSDGGDGCLEITRFTGGRMILDRVGDIPVYRLIDCQLDIRVFSRTPISDTPGPSIEEIDQAPNLTIIG